MKNIGELDSSQELISHNGERFAVKRYVGIDDDTLSSLLKSVYIKFQTKNPANPEKLPPASRSIHYHSLSTYLQDWQWMNLNLEILPVTDWGFIITNDAVSPIKTNKDAIPLLLLDKIQCNCKSTSKGQCLQQCPCRKNWKYCLDSCSHCSGVTCTNVKPMILDAEEDTNNDNRNVLVPFF